MSKEKVHVECSFSVHYTLEMELEDGEDFLERICGKQIFTLDSTSTDVLSKSFINLERFGLDDCVLREQGITVVESDWDGDPSPTGRGIYRREWEIAVEVENDAQDK